MDMLKISIDGYQRKRLFGMYRTDLRTEELIFTNMLERKSFEVKDFAYDIKPQMKSMKPKEITTIDTKGTKFSLG